MKKFIFILLICLCLVGCNQEDNNPNDEDKDIDVSMVEFKDATFVYSGEFYSIECINVPDGVTVEYEGNNQKEVGSYTVVAFLKDNYSKELNKLQATLTILPHEDIDCSMVEFKDATFVYSGEFYSIECINVPDGVTVDYEGNNQSEVGSYTVVATLKDGYGNVIKTLEANLTINEVVVESLSTPLLSITSDGIVSWDKVEGASHYNYIINDGEVLSTTHTTIAINDKETISVQAANENSVSKWSYAVTNYDVKEEFIEEEKTIYVKFHNVNLETIVLNGKGKIEKPIAPTKSYYTFDNWYKDPYYMEVFDFDQEITSSTIIYANYIPSELINDTYFWVKASPQITGNVMSEGTNSDWHFIPLKVNTSCTSYKEFIATVTVSGATTTSPAYFLVMDGFSDDSGRTYWKNNNADFAITTDGVYNIYFSLEFEYASGVHAKYQVAPNSASTLDGSLEIISLNTPVISVDDVNNEASWQSVSGATSYEVIIDNGDVIETTNLKVSLEKGSFVVVRALSGDSYSNWSIPKANIKKTIVKDEDNNASVYFVGYDSYLVEKGSSVNSPVNPSKENFTFGGWYLDVSCTTPATFPYVVNENIVFYPKWETNSDYETKHYYNLVLNDGTIVKGLTWNLDNYTFDEYETGVVHLNANTEYYVVSTSDSNIKYGPYKVNTSGSYKLYFSEENSWDGSNVYIAANTKRIYFSNSKRWTDTIYAYVWNSTTGSFSASWPGAEMTYLETNSYGEEIYYIDVDLSLYDMIIFSHGTNGSVVTQTIDISLITYTNNGFYVTDKVNGKYEIGTYSK